MVEVEGWRHDWMLQDKNLDFDDAWMVKHRNNDCCSERYFAVRALAFWKTGVRLHVSSGMVVAYRQPYYHEVVA